MKVKGKHNFETMPQNSGTDLVKTDDSRLSDARTPSAHNLGGSEHSADTLANLNTKVSDATLIDTGDSRLSDDRTASGIKTATTTVAVSGATAPTTGQVLKATSSTAATWQNDDSSAGKNDVVVSFDTDSAPYVAGSLGASYSVRTAFFFRGTTALGTPSNIRVIKQASAASPTHSLKIYDVTNSQTIAEVTGISSTSLDILDMGTLSNLPAGEAIFELQGKRDAGGSTTLDLYSLAIIF